MQSFSLIPSNYGIELLSEVEELKAKLSQAEKEKVQLLEYIQSLEAKIDDIVNVKYPSVKKSNEIR